MTQSDASQAREALDAPHIKKKRPYAWLKLEESPPLLWSDGEIVSHSHLQKLLGLLSLEGPDTFDPSSWAIFAGLMPAIRVQFSELLETQWLEAGARPAHKWAIYQLAALGAKARLATRAVKLIELATHGNHKRASWYLEAMSRVDDPELRSWIFDLSLHAPYHSTLHTQALMWHDHLIAISPVDRSTYMSRLNLYIREEHMEASIEVPDFTPGESSVMLGETRYLVTFLDAGFELGVRHATTRKLSSSLPTNQMAYDPTELRLAHNTFEALEAQIAPFVAEWQATFERAMISARPYSYAYLRARFLPHPLMSHLIQSLVWVTPQGKTVRLLEGSCFDVNDEEVELEDTALKLVHPMELDADEVNAWSMQFAQDEVFPLFEQLTREVYTPREHPMSELLTQFRAHSPQVIMKLLYEQGWRHGAVDHGSYVESYHVLPGRHARIWLHHGTLSFSEGIATYGASPLRLSRVRIHDLMTGDAIAQDEVDPVVYSEAYRLIKNLVMSTHL